MSLLELSGITKHYGDVAALKGLDLRVDAGEIYGFLGRNGAGKSTSMQVVMGITHPDAGSLRLFGEEVRAGDPRHRMRIGYVAQEQHFYDWMTVARLGRFVAGFYPTWDDAEFARLATLLEIPPERKVRGLSGGVRAKLALALALAHRPDLLLLDEPTAGMDAVARREFIDIVRDQAVRFGRTTVFSSHLIDEVEQAADRIGIVDAGRMRYEGSLADLRHSVWRLEGYESFALPASLPFPHEVLRDTVQDGRRQVTVNFGDTPPPPPFRVEPWRLVQPSLEDMFIAMVGQTVVL